MILSFQYEINGMSPNDTQGYISIYFEKPQKECGGLEFLQFFIIKRALKKRVHWIAHIASCHTSFPRVQLPSFSLHFIWLPSSFLFKKVPSCCSNKNVSLFLHPQKRNHSPTIPTSHWLVLVLHCWAANQKHLLVLSASAAVVAAPETRWSCWCSSASAVGCRTTRAPPRGHSWAPWRSAWSPGQWATHSSQSRNWAPLWPAAWSWCVACAS